MFFILINIFRRLLEQDGMYGVGYFLFWIRTILHCYRIINFKVALLGCLPFMSDFSLFFVWCICVVYYLIVSLVVSLFIQCSKLLFFLSSSIYVFLLTKLFQGAHCRGCVVSFRFFFSVTIHANFDHWLQSLLNIGFKVAGTSTSITHTHTIALQTKSK